MIKNVVVCLCIGYACLVTVACGKKAKAEAPVVQAPVEVKEEVKEEVVQEEVQEQPDLYADKREPLVVEPGMMRNNERKMWDRARKHWRRMNKCEQPEL